MCTICVDSMAGADDADATSHHGYVVFKCSGCIRAGSGAAGAGDADADIWRGVGSRGSDGHLPAGRRAQANAGIAARLTDLSLVFDSFVSRSYWVFCPEGHSRWTLCAGECRCSP